MEQNISNLQHTILEQYRDVFKGIDDISLYNTNKVISAFRKHRISDYHFNSTSGYGYDDIGRDKLDELYAEIFNCEAALVRMHFVSGTHALASVLLGILRPGDELVAATGAPYDTMQTVIGHTQPSPGSLKEWGVSYKEVPLTKEGDPDIDAIQKAITSKSKVALIQRSRGYSLRPALSLEQIQSICEAIKAVNKDCACFVDNCYGEFVEKHEPVEFGADIMAGSLIKNLGGGLAPAGGYIAGKRELVELVSYRLTAPGLGAHVGATLGDQRLLYQGLFLAPHVVGQAVKAAIYEAGIFAAMGYKTFPMPNEKRHDIIQAVEFGCPKKMVAFCQAIQKNSPINAHVAPEAGDIPGYEDKVVMAAGTFVQGASIELSADGPIRPPYAVYIQGALTFEHAIIAINSAVESIQKV